MSAENVEIVRRGYVHFAETGEPSELIGPGFVWDMSTFRNWPERQTYEGIEGVHVQSACAEPVSPEGSSL